MPPRLPPVDRPPVPPRPRPPRFVRRPLLAAQVARAVPRRTPALPESVRRVAPPPAIGRVAAAPARSPTAYRGPDPYADFQRDFTDAGGIRLTFKVKDQQAWRTVIRALLWLAAVAVTLWFAFRASPFPMVPARCLGGRCAGTLMLAHVGGNAVLLGLAAAAYAWILFPEDQTYASLEVRPDCLIVDGCDTFWRAHMDLGWPQLAPGPDGSFILRGAYGTRAVDYLTVHAFDEQDRTVQVLGAHLQLAMQQLWSHPIRN